VSLDGRVHGADPGRGQWLFAPPPSAFARRSTNASVSRAPGCRSSGGPADDAASPRDCVGVLLASPSGQWAAVGSMCRPGGRRPLRPHGRLLRHPGTGLKLPEPWLAEDELAMADCQPDGAGLVREEGRAAQCCPVPRGHRTTLVSGADGRVPTPARALPARRRSDPCFLRVSARAANRPANLRALR